ncbi:hypothetical protein BDZ89DRAFT_1133602 [Hymenopellis radicata]|nr:hypothetical protein BDZ89DRAFT_1133602 [Hymenopellis radicata]
MFSPVAARDIQHLQRRWYLEVRQDRNDTQSGVEGSSSVAADGAASTSFADTSSPSVSALEKTALSSSSTVSSSSVPQSSSSFAVSSVISPENSATSSSSFTESTTSASSSSPSSSSVTSLPSTSSTFSTSSVLSVSFSPTSSSAPLTSASPSSSSPGLNTAAIADTGPVTTLSGDAVSASSTVIRVSSASEPSSTVSNGVVGASSNSFWSNKSAVAGTFAVVGLVSLAIIAGIVMFIIRLRRRQTYDEDFTYPVTDKWSPEPGLRRSASPDPSLSEPPMDVFANREVFANNYSSTHGAPAPMQYTSPGNYFNTDAPQQFVQNNHSNQSQYYDTNISHNYGPESTPDIIYTYAADVDRQYPVFPEDGGASSTQLSSGRPSPSQHPSPSPSPQQRYSNPFKDNVTGLAVPPAEPVDRVSVSASSIDSFYGANSTTAGVAL